jgi:hypothetical protein
MGFAANIQRRNIGWNGGDWVWLFLVPLDLFPDFRISADVHHVTLRRLNESKTTALTPEVPEPIWRQLGVTNRVLDVLVAEIGL